MKIFEIFDSINGEVNGISQGVRSTFVRFAGCNLKCPYCDTLYAREKESGEIITVEQIVKKIISMKNHVIVFTGGEPLLYEKEILDIIILLEKNNFYYKIIVETNGTVKSMFLMRNDKRNDKIYFVVDYKLPSSNVNINEINFLYKDLSKQDIIKFVISDEIDFYCFVNTYKIIKEYSLAQIAVSANTKIMSYKKLFTLLQENKIYDIIFNVQIHKLINFK